MKFIIALALFSTTAAFAQGYSPVYPRLYNWGSTVEVEARNHNRIGVNCSGSVRLELRSGERVNTYVSMFVPANGWRTHRIYLRDPQDRVVFASHSIWCR